MSTNPDKLKQIIEGALLAAGRPLSVDSILSLFLDEDQPSRDEIREAVKSLQDDCANRGVELKEVSTGFRYQVKADLAEWVTRLWEEKASKYSRATLETLALIAYRQPITRSEIEDVRGVSVSSHIVKSMLEREWIRVIGHRDVPGRPALYGTTKSFLDYFGLKSLSELPPLAELRNIDSIERELDFGDISAEAKNDDQPAELEQGEVQPVAIAGEEGNSDAEQTADAAEKPESDTEKESSADADTSPDEQPTTAETAAPNTEQAF
ncbi:MAG TPA: SMC-Scp complex subunit ScpB [Candidatus Tenderia electrophaga]|uniref:SMC-Scp complex subunit ScpB n=1 Tax=Candidatus Tenderia electrophaga TaxID=1748243 RepID=A0A832J657_9GAMM|nr:SMC-Scp complex subunit ScpB [Candidatus Tenderia electrophaga]